MLTVGFNIAVGGISFFAVILFSVALRKGWLFYWAYPVSDAVPSNIELLFQEERLIDVSPNAKILLPMFCEPTLEGVGDFFRIVLITSRGRSIALHRIIRSRLHPIWKMIRLSLSWSVLSVGLCYAFWPLSRISPWPKLPIEKPLILNKYCTF